MNWLSKLSGYRTYIAAIGSILSTLAATATSIATILGGLDLSNGAVITTSLMAFAAICGSFGMIFQRMGTANNAAVFFNALEDLRAEFNLSKPNPTPVPTPSPTDPFATIPSRSSVINGLCLLIVLSAGAVASAAPPVASIAGPRMAEPGEEVVFDASKSEGDPKLFAWRVTPLLEGRKQLTILEGGAKVRLASFPGTYRVRVMLANTDGIDDEEIVITIPGTPPCPPTPEPVPTPVPVPPTPVVPTPVPVPPTPLPTPVPTPPVPVPDLPPGEFDGLPAAIKALALTVVSPNRAAEAQKLADAFEALAAQIAAGTLKTPISIVAAVGTSFNASVSPAWDTAFRTPAVARMKALYEAGKLGDPTRWRAMLLEAATGLRAVK